MAAEDQKNISEHSHLAGGQENADGVPSDREVFASDAAEAAPQAKKPVSEAHGTIPTAAASGRKRFSTIQKVLAASIVLVGAILLYELWRFVLPPRRGPELKSMSAVRPEPLVQQATLPKLPARETTQKLIQQIQKPESDAGPIEQPLSLQVARGFYLNGDYEKAYDAYKQLHQNLSTDTEAQLMRDFLQLKMALCMEKAGNIEQAGQELAIASKSRCPAVSVVANYNLGLIEMQKEQYLKARSRFYKAFALINAIDFDRDWALSLQRNCHFLAAECLTRKVLSLCDADKNLPKELWDTSAQIDPFTDLNETQLRTLLNSGLEELIKVVLGPQIQQVRGVDDSLALRWSAVCYGASNEELLVRFAANAGLDIQWACGPADSVQADAVRKRPVTLYLAAVTTQQFITTTAGCVGLLARLDDEGVINIFNPADYSSLSEHLSLLSQEAISVWQRFLLGFHDDQRVANVHFALGLLHAQEGDVSGAIAEYKLVANRFSQTPLAPFALLHSSRLKAELHDYSGVRQDLRQLVEQYPDSEIAAQAYLQLGETTMNAGLYDEATRLFQKVYNLSPSSEYQRAAALEAGRCFYEIKDYQSAAKWLTRYINLARDIAERNLYSAYLLLGKALAALGKTQQACEAFQYALAGQLSREECAEAISALVKGYTEQGHFIQALDTLENVRPSQLSPKGSIEMLLLKCQTLRAMGLVDKAIAELGDKAEYILESELKTKVSLELVNCHIAKEDLERAYKSLTEILVFAEPGPLAHESAVKLADVCLKLRRDSQAISVCSQLLDLEPSEKIKQKALNILATAYNRQKNYDQAALALLDQWQPGKNLDEKNDF